MKKSQHLHIGISLAIAVLIHVVLFLTFNFDYQPVMINFAEKPASISITLDTIHIAATLIQVDSPPKKNKNIRKTKKIQTQEIKPTVHKNIASIPPRQKSSQPDAVAATTNSDKQKNISAINRAKLLTRLSRELNEQYFIYPVIAQRNNIQGTVLLGFGIKQTGLIHDIHIIKSSGFSILDLAAEQSMQRLHKVNWIKGMFAQANINLELPIIYNLVE